MFIRGFSSLNATNQPLVVVDGMIYDINSYGSSLIPGYRVNPLSGIDIYDIENITVLKDAAAIYGAKAANGVILITTERTHRQATSIDFRMHGGINLEPEIYPLMDADNYKFYLGDMMLSAGYDAQEIAEMPYFANNPSQTGYYRMNNNTNWQKEVFNRSYTSNFGLKIKGGDDVALYALGVGYLHQGGMVENSDYSKMNLRFNSDINFSQSLTLNSNISFVYHERDIGATGFESPDDVVTQARIKAPFMHPYIFSEAGLQSSLMEDFDGLGVGNPMAVLSNHTLRDQNYRFFGSFNFNLKVNNKINVSNLIGLLFDKDRETIFIPSHGLEPIETPLGTITNKMGSRVMRHFALNNDLKALYSNRFGYAHGLNAVLGVRLNLNNNEEDWGRGFSSANDNLRTLSHGLPVLRQKGGFSGEWNNVTWYLSGDYDFKKRYFVNLSMALDGSSRFGKDADGINFMGSVYGFFPSLSGAWLLSSEPFLNNSDFLDVLKLRAGYGITGNDDIGDHSARRYYITQNLLSYQGIILGNIYNPTLKWETNTKINLGIDFALFRERLSGSIEIYQNNTKDMIDLVSESVFSGFEYSIVNDGEFSTQGIDLALNAQIINKPLKWDLGLIISKFETNVKAISGNRKISSFYGANILTEVNKPLGVFYGYKTNGVYATNQEAEEAGLMAVLPNTDLVPFGGGDIRFVDVNKDEVINEKDMQVIGDPTPDFFGEFYTNIKWNRLSLNAALSFSVGGDIYNYQRRQLESMNGFENQTKAVLNRWQYEGQNTNIPRASYGDLHGNSRFSDRWIEDGSYAKLRSITLAYDVPAKLIGIRSLEVYASGNNLLTITKYKGPDPVFSAGTSPLLRGIDLGMLPHTTSFILGIKIGL